MTSMGRVAACPLPTRLLTFRRMALALPSAFDSRSAVELDQVLEDKPDVDERPWPQLRQMRAELIDMFNRPAAQSA